MGKTTNTTRCHHAFGVGDWVFLYQQAYRPTSLTDAPHHKLSRKFYGSYLITNRIGEVTYELALSPTSNVHLVFHISLLKPY